jgi:hypothetical protein
MSNLAQTFFLGYNTRVNHTKSSGLLSQHRYPFSKFCIGEPTMIDDTTRRKSHTPEQRFLAKVDQRGPDECWPWIASFDGKGYGQFWDGERRRPAHAYAFELFYGVYLGEYICCHACDNPACVNPHHLFSGTVADNMRDMRDKGRRYQPDVRGEKNGRAKLTEATVEVIRFRYASGESSRELARAFGVNRTTIIRAIQRNSGS